MSTLFLTYVRNKVDFVTLASRDGSKQGLYIVLPCYLLLLDALMHFRTIAVTIYNNVIPVLRKLGFALSERE